MMTLCSLLKPFTSILCILFNTDLPSMALPKWQSASDNDPWKVSAFVSATMELFLSILLLLGAAISFFTSRIVNFFGLEPPCTYMGCSHPLHSANHEVCTLGLKGQGAVKDGEDSHGGCGADRHGSCSDNLHYVRRQMQRKQSLRRAVAHAHSNGKRKEEDHPALLFARFGSESNDRFDAEDDSEVFQTSADFEEEGPCKETDRRDEDAHNPNIELLQQSEAFKGHTSGGEKGRGDDLPMQQHGEVLKGHTSVKERDGKDEDASDHDTTLLPHSEAFRGHTSVEEKENRRDEDACNHHTVLPQHSEAFEGQTSVEETGWKEDDACDHHAILPRHSEAFEGHMTVEETDMKGENACDQGTMLLPNSEAFKGRASDEETDKRDEEASGHDRILPELSEALKRHTSVKVADRRDEDSHKHHMVLLHQPSDEAFRGHAWVAADASQSLGALKGEQSHNVDSSSELLNETNRMVDVSNRDHSSIGLEDNQCCIQFGSISACTKDHSLGQLNVSSVFLGNKALLMASSEGDESGEEAIVQEVKQGEGLDALKMALEAEKSALEAELEQERNAAAIATSEAMAMISRLQEEKSAMQMEVAQLQRMSEERANYDEQVMMVLKEILFKREKESIALEKEVEFYKEKLWEVETVESNEVFFKGASGNLAIEPCNKPLLLIGKGSPVGSFSPHQASTPASENHCQTGNAYATWIPQSGVNTDLGEHKIVSLCQNSSNRLGDSSASDKVPCHLLDDRGRYIHDMEDRLYGLPHSAHQEAKEMGRCLSATDEEALSACHNCLWMAEETLHELQGKEECKSEKQADEHQCSACRSAENRAIGNLSDSCSTRSNCGMRSEGPGEVDGVCVPVHDVYEVHTASNRNAQHLEERDSLDCMPRYEELRIAETSLRFPRSAKQIVLEETPCTPISMVHKAGWDIDKPSYPAENLLECHDLQVHPLDLRKEKRAELEIQQLAMRLKALEEDRDLLREMVESFKHRDVELSLLQEISQHLQELRAGGFYGGFLSEETSVSSPSRSHAPKKRRRHCSSPRQALMTLLQQQKIS